MMASCCAISTNAASAISGVEPSVNVADVARERGIRTICAFFDRQLADEIVAEHGRADAILAANVMCHIPDLAGVAAGVRRLLKPDGVFIFEDPYLGDMIAKTSYDQIYDEHVFIFSATSVDRAFADHGLELVDVAPQITHGGSMRYMLAPQGQPAGSPRGSPSSSRRSGRKGSIGPKPICNSSAIASNSRAADGGARQICAVTANAWSVTARPRKARR